MDQSEGVIKVATEKSTTLGTEIVGLLKELGEVKEGFTYAAVMSDFKSALSKAPTADLGQFASSANADVRIEAFTEYVSRADAFVLSAYDWILAEFSPRVLLEFQRILLASPLIEHFPAWLVQTLCDDLRNSNEGRELLLKRYGQVPGAKLSWAVRRYRQLSSETERSFFESEVFPAFLPTAGDQELKELVKEALKPSISQIHPRGGFAYRLLTECVKRPRITEASLVAWSKVVGRQSNSFDLLRDALVARFARESVSQLISRIDFRKITRSPDDQIVAQAAAKCLERRLGEASTSELQDLWDRFERWDVPIKHALIRVYADREDGTADWIASDSTTWGSDIQRLRAYAALRHKDVKAMHIESLFKPGFSAYPDRRICLAYSRMVGSSGKQIIAWADSHHSLIPDIEDILTERSDISADDVASLITNVGVTENSTVVRIYAAKPGSKTSQLLGWTTKLVGDHRTNRSPNTELVRLLKSREDLTAAMIMDHLQSIAAEQGRTGNLVGKDDYEDRRKNPAKYGNIGYVRKCYKEVASFFDEFLAATPVSILEPLMRKYDGYPANEYLKKAYEAALASVKK